MGIAIIVHGGAGAIAPERFGAAREGCRAAALAGWRVLQAGGSALDAAQVAVMTLEDDPGFNAGTGATLTADGRAQLDAGMMDGARLDVGAVAGVERIKHPIALARRVLASPHALLMSAGAEQFAVEQGMALCDPRELVTEAQYALWRERFAGAGAPSGADLVAVSELSPSLAAHEPAPLGEAPSEAPIHRDGTEHGTVGAVAVDARGDVAAATSTGGMAAKHPGRIGDTPLPGCGFYAENGLGGVSSTGRGEDFIRLLLAKRAVDLLAAGLSAEAAAQAAIRLLGERIGGEGGLILLDAQGRPGYARNTPSMASAYIVEGMEEPLASV